MNTPSTPTNDSQLTDILGLRRCGIFPRGKEPSIRTLCDRFVCFNPAEIGEYIRTKLKVPARG